MQKLNNFFNPKSVAIIGASHDSKKLGFQILSNIIVSGFRGKVIPVNPNAKYIKGIKSYPSVLNIPGKVDLAIIVIPKNIVPAAVKECGVKGIKSLIIITAGFGETGNEGEKQEKEILEIAEKYNIRIIGPNCLGIIDTFTPINASFAESGLPLKKNLAVISQSGAMCSAILDWASKNCVGFSKFISLGNKKDVDEVDLFKLLSNDKNSKVVLGYFEGINKGKKFIKEASVLTKKKPTIAIKAGVSEEGAKAASSHTGSLATDAKIIDAAFSKAGIIQVSSLQDLFDLAEAFSVLPLPKNNKVTILSNAGGPAVLATDALSSSDLSLARLSSNSNVKLRAFLPEAASIRNPIDIIGDADAKRFKCALDILLADKNVSSLIVILTPQTSTEIEETAKAIVKAGKKYKKPIITSFIGGRAIEKGVHILEKGNIPNLEFPERAVYVLDKLFWYKKHRDSSYNVNNKKINRDIKIENIFKRVKKEGRKNLNDLETKKIIKSIGIDASRSFFAKSLHEAKKAALKLGFPVVMKIVSSDILHKTEYGLVKTGLSAHSDVEKAYKEIIKNAKKHKIKYSGVIVYETIQEGTEVIIGVKKDKVFGHVIMFGLGGIYVELLKDTTFSILPITDKEALNMIMSIKGEEILTGFRGQKAVNVKKIKEALIKISNLVTSFPEISELDINPLRVDSKKVVALDIKITIE